MSDKTIAVFADTAEAYEELCSGARALGGRPVALWAGDEADAQRIAAWGARVMHVGAVPEGALYEDCVPAFQEVVQAEQPTLILARMSKRTQCVAGRLAVRLGVPVVTDASRVKLDDEGVLWEIMRDRAALEELTGESVRGFAYPQGAYDERIAGLVRSVGFEYARTAGSAHGFDLPRDMTAWRPSCHYAEDEVPELCERFISAEPETGIYSPGVEAKLFTVFAHSYEFEHREDWGRMEDIARTLGGRNDIWYCTFIGYCRYAKAFGSLDFNLERTWG